MTVQDSMEIVGLNLKMLGRQSKKNVLISAGKREDKLMLLESVRDLAKLDVRVFCTEGTSKFLTEQNVPNELIYKIAEGKEPNIKSFLEADRLDLVVNILTGDHNYDANSDNNRIRAFAVQNSIPLITDPEVAKLTIDQIVKNVREGTYQYKVASTEQPWNLRAEFLKLVAEYGGFACHHAHFDKAYLISLKNLELSQVDMQHKWKLYKSLKENYTFEDLFERISRGVETMLAQGVRYCRTMVDADSTVKTLPMEAAIEVKKKYAGRIEFEIGVQPLQGVLDPESRKQYEKACELGDFCGGLPSKDRPTPEKHLDIIMKIAKSLNKPLEVHVDQENNPYESETEQLAAKTVEHGMEGRVYAIHAISMSAKAPSEQERIIQKVKDAGVGVVVCPSAALSMKQLEISSPLHNSIAPVPALLKAGVPTYLGVDNIHDLFMPIVDGDMWVECRMLMEACRFYDIRTVAKLACARRVKV
jgi:cytosine/creatinine deaminase